MPQLHGVKKQNCLHGHFHNNLPQFIMAAIMLIPPPLELRYGTTDWNQFFQKNTNIGSRIFVLFREGLGLSKVYGTVLRNETKYFSSNICIT